MEDWELVSSAFSVSFDLICCSTDANCTSCCVNWFVSRGSSGFWFWSCVVSSSRNASKFCGDRLAVRRRAPACVAAAAARADARCHGRPLPRSCTSTPAAPRQSRCGRVGAGRSPRAAPSRRCGVPCAAARSPWSRPGRGGRRRRVAQREIDSALRRLQAGLLEGPLQRPGIALQQVEGLDPVDDEMRLDLAAPRRSRAARRCARVRPDRGGSRSGSRRRGS